MLFWLHMISDRELTNIRVSISASERQQDDISCRILSQIWKKEWGMEIDE